jgi:hypothetical protein
MYTEKELNRLIEEVEKEFTAHLAKTEESFNASVLAKSEESAPAPVVEDTAPLAKAEDEKPAAKEEKEEPKEEPKSEEKPAAEAKEGEGEKPAAEAPAKEEGDKEAAPAEKQDAAPAEAGAEDSHGYDDEDLDHMSKMYASMSKAELKAHHDAIKSCLDNMGMAKCGEQTMVKSETETSVEVKPEVVSEKTAEVELLKSEISAKEAKVEELQKSLDVVTEFLTKLFSKKPAPAGKAITNLDAITKSEEVKEEKPLTKGEITTLLAKKAADPTLTKSDREAINAYYLNGASIDKISHLLK